jgi:lambda repressor-like predicted transcriptional regulator
LNVQELLNYRTQFEEITSDFKLDYTGSSINTLKWFVENGHKSNSLRNGYQKAYEIAEAIITEYENGRTEETRDG